MKPSKLFKTIRGQIGLRSGKSSAFHFVVGVSYRFTSPIKSKQHVSAGACHHGRYIAHLFVERFLSGRLSLTQHAQDHVSSDSPCHCLTRPFAPAVFSVANIRVVASSGDATGAEGASYWGNAGAPPHATAWYAWWAAGMGVELAQRVEWRTCSRACA